MRWRALAVAYGLAATVALAGCGAASFAPAPPLPDQAGASADAVLYLVGDAGDPGSGSPILTALREDAAGRARTAPVTVAFLGDNIYENGLDAEGDPEREHDLLALERQLAAVRGTGARGLFLSGNHDWGHGGERGLEQVRRQAAYVNASSSDDLDVAFVPEGGCPGPVTEPLGASVLLIALDTEWLLRYETDAPGGVDCEPSTAAGAYRELRRLLSQPEATTRHVVVLVHHTLKTNGSHGGYFGIKDQLFPLTHLWAPLYLPIPFLYPIARNSGISAQDMSNPSNHRMRDSLATAAESAPRPPLAFASGHEHSLQVFREPGFGSDWLLVSGAGSRLRPVERGDALFAAGSKQGELGYMRLEFFPDGRVLLSVVTDGTGGCRGMEATCRPAPTVRYWTWLSRPGR